MEPQNEAPLTLFLSTRQKCVGLRWLLLTKKRKPPSSWPLAGEQPTVSLKTSLDQKRPKYPIGHFARLQTTRLQERTHHLYLVRQSQRNIS